MSSQNCDVVVRARQSGNSERMRALVYLKKLLADGRLSPSRQRLVEAEIRELEKTRA